MLPNLLGYLVLLTTLIEPGPVRNLVVCRGPKFTVKVSVSMCTQLTTPVVLKRKDKRFNVLFFRYIRSLIHGYNHYCTRMHAKISWKPPASTSSYPSTCRPQAYHVQECDLDLAGMMGNREPGEDAWVTRDVLKSQVVCIPKGIDAYVHVGALDQHVVHQLFSPLRQWCFSC